MPRTVKEYRRRYIKQLLNDIERTQSRLKKLQETIPNPNFETKTFCTLIELNATTSRKYAEELLKYFG